MRVGHHRHIIFFLAISLTLMGCAKRRSSVRNLFESGFGYCTNEALGNFDIALTRSSEQPGFFQLRIQSVTTTEIGGQYMQVAIANQDLDHEVLVPALLVRDNQLLYDGFLSPAQIELYNLVVIAPYRGGSGGFLQSESENDEAICQIPVEDAAGNTI